jgi:mannobiose 2-epimerase
MTEVELLDIYAAEVQSELTGILEYWMKNMPDNQFGGYIGRIKDDNTRDAQSQKGSVLNSRILWAFSAAYNQTGEGKYLDHADRAYRYFIEHFIDKEYGGVYWSVEHNGEPADTKKQIYAQAFAIYALAEYYKCDPSQEVLLAAIDIFQHIEKHSFDNEHGGYLEAFSREWDLLSDQRLSEKDANEKKTMNTHLHLLEAYANLFIILPDDKLKERISKLLDNFLDHFINENTGHLELYFDDEWNLKSTTISYGHDVEAAWLLPEAAELTGEEDIIEKFHQASVNLATAAVTGLDEDGGLWYESNAGNMVREKHWWVQAEAMVGFFNAWQINNDAAFLEKSYSSWHFIKTSLLDQPAGEWHWGTDENNVLMSNKDKAGLWKCPYHNARACMVILNRIMTLDVYTNNL